MQKKKTLSTGKVYNFLTVKWPRTLPLDMNSNSMWQQFYSRIRLAFKCSEIYLFIFTDSVKQVCTALPQSSQPYLRAPPPLKEWRLVSKRYFKSLLHPLWPL